MVSLASAPAFYGPYGPPEARLACLHSRHPPPSPTPSPVVREAEEIEGVRSVPVRRRWASERDQACLLWVESKTIAFEALAQHGHHPSRILLLFERDDQVIGEADESRLPVQPRLHLRLEPHIEHVMQIDV